MDTLVKNLSKDDLKYLSQEFDSEVLDPVKQKRFSSYEYINNFEMFKERLRSREKNYSLLTSKRTSDEIYEHFFKIWDIFQIKTMKNYHDLYLKCDVLLLSNVFWKLQNVN